MTDSKYKRVLVTGGHGFLGKNLKKHRPGWIYVGSEYDLSNTARCKKMFRDYAPDAVVHLAAKVGGIKQNATQQAEFYYSNMMININVVHEAYKAQVPRVLASLSTCAFPDVVTKYPFTEEDLLIGRPTLTNLSYGFAKRSLYIQALSYRKQYGANYSCFCPSNIYGPDDNFNLENSHFVAAMIKKIHGAVNGDVLEFWGDGKSLKQQLYVDDLATIIPLLLEKHNSETPLIVSPSENLSIDKMIKICLKEVNKNHQIRYNNKFIGQFRKDGSNKRLLNLIGDYDFTSFEDGVRQTYEWYERNYK